MEVLECSQHYKLIFKTLKCCWLHSQCWNLAEIWTHSSFYACPPYLWKWRRSNLKWRLLSVHVISPIISLWGFFQMLKGSLIRSPCSDLAKFKTHPRLFGCPRYLQTLRRSNQKMKVLECSQHFPHYNPMGAFYCYGNQSSGPIWPKS